MELKATRNTRLSCLVMVLLMIFGIFINTGTNIYADDNVKKETNVDIEEQKKQAVENLKFYLEEVGHIDPMTHQYIPTDLAALKAKSELPGEEGIAGKFIFDNYVIPSMTRDLQKYAACVVLNSLPFGGVVWDALQGENAMQILLSALQGQNYDKAVEILVDIAEKTLSPSQFAKFNVATIVASVAINAISCWGN